MMTILRWFKVFNGYCIYTYKLNNNTLQVDLYINDYKIKTYSKHIKYLHFMSIDST